MLPPTMTEEDDGTGLARRVARLLRHEVGDLLQTIYSTTAILTERLPTGLSQERRLVADLKGRAEVCKVELDAVVELLGPNPLKPTRVELALLLGSVVAQAKRRYPTLDVPFDSEPGLFVNADGQSLSGSVGFLLLALCQAARRQVVVRLGRAGDRAVCTLERDGYSVAPDQLNWLREPFATTQQALFGLALALSRRTIEPCGGSIAILPREDGGPRVEISFPILDA